MYQPVLELEGNQQSERKAGKRKMEEMNRTVSLFEKKQDKTKLAVLLGREDSSTGTFKKTKCRRKAPEEYI